MPNLTDAVDAEVFLEHTFDPGRQISITSGTVGQTRRVHSLGQMVIKRRWGNRQHMADWLDPKISTVIFYEPDHRLNGRSSSVPPPDSTCLHVREEGQNMQTLCEGSRWPA